MHRRLLSLAFVAASLGCGASPTQVCRDTVSLQCKRAFECTTPQEQATAQFVGIFGASETECNSKLSSQQCARVTDSQPCSDSSKKYQPDKAQACINDYKSASCETIRGGTFNSDNCNLVCK